MIDEIIGCDKVTIRQKNSYLFIIQTSYHLDFEEFDTHVLYLLH